MAAIIGKLTPRNTGTLELNAAVEVERAALAREHAAFGVPGHAADATLDGDGEPTVRIKVPAVRATPSAGERALHEASGHPTLQSSVERRTTRYQFFRSTLSKLGLRVCRKRCVQRKPSSSWWKPSLNSLSSGPERGHVAFRPGTTAGTDIEGSPEQTNEADIRATWSKSGQD